MSEARLTWTVKDTKQLEDEIDGMSFAERTAVKELKLHGAIENLPRDINNLSGLQCLDLSGCPRLRGFSEFINLPKLQCLVLKGCSSIPECFSKSPKLQEIDLSGCAGLSTLPDWMFGLPELRTLNLSGCRELRRLPASVGRLAKLRHLSMKGSAITSLPESVGHLQQLLHLDLSGCKELQWLPDSMGQLRQLQRLDLSGCDNLQTPPASIGNLTTLQHLNVPGSAITPQPESMDNLQPPQHLDLSGRDNLQTPPASIGNLTTLQHLNVPGSAITPQPESMDNLQPPQHLDLSDKSVCGGRGDAPTTEDKIGVDCIAMGAATFLLNESTPAMTLGIYGPWGSGKSTIMHLMQQHMKAVMRQQVLGDRGLTEDNLTDDASAGVDSFVKDRLVFVWFNAWEYLTSHEVWGGLMVEIIKAVEINFNWKQRWWLTAQFNIQQRGMQLLVDVIVPVAALIALVIIFAVYGRQILAAYDSTQSAAEATVPVAVIVVITIFVRQWLLNITPMSQAIKDTVQQMHGAAEHKVKLGYQQQVREHIKFLKNHVCGPEPTNNSKEAAPATAADTLGTTSTRGSTSAGNAAVATASMPAGPLAAFANTIAATFGLKCRQLVRTDQVRRTQMTQLNQQPKQPTNELIRQKRRVVVFIDDLDRCQPSKVVEVLEAISLVLCADSGFTVVIGMDKPVVQDAIAQFYNFGDGQQAETFLQKIVQVEISLASPNCTQLGKLLVDLIPPQLETNKADKRVPLATGSSSNVTGSSGVGNGGGGEPASNTTDNTKIVVVVHQVDGTQSALQTGANVHDLVAPGHQPGETPHATEPHNRAPASPGQPPIVNNQPANLDTQTIRMTQLPPPAPATYKTEESEAMSRVLRSLIGNAPVAELRDVKRLINHHRLARNILRAQEFTLESRMPSVYTLEQLVYWVALWWRVPQAMDVVIKESKYSLPADEQVGAVAKLSDYCNMLIKQQKMELKTLQEKLHKLAYIDDGGHARMKQLQSSHSQLQQLRKQDVFLNTFDPAAVRSFTGIQLGFQYVKGNADVNRIVIDAPASQDASMQHPADIIAHLTLPADMMTKP